MMELDASKRWAFGAMKGGYIGLPSKDVASCKKVHITVSEPEMVAYE
jgi:hypothetical protein